MKPSIGRIVHYTTTEAIPRVHAAVISEVLNDHDVHLHVFVPTQRSEAIQVIFKVPFADEQPGSTEARGSWNWPVRV